MRAEGSLAFLLTIFYHNPGLFDNTKMRIFSSEHPLFVRHKGIEPIRCSISLCLKRVFFLVFAVALGKIIFAVGLDMAQIFMGFKAAVVYFEHAYRYV